MKTHQPKGGMCAGCINRDADCSSFGFVDMPVIEHGEHVNIVKCVYYEKAPTPYETACLGANEKARFKLSNYLAHGWKLKAVGEIIMLTKDDRILFMDKQGNQWIGTEAI